MIDQKKTCPWGLLYTYICMCVVLSVRFVHCVSITYRDFLCTRSREYLKIELIQMGEKKRFFFIHQM